jgi:hypothetical protein
MKCINCGIEVSKEFKAALTANKCPGCGKRIIESGNLSAFVPLCELLAGFKSMRTEGGGLYEDDIEALATLIISTFNVAIKGGKTQPEPEVEGEDPDAAYKARQMAEGKKTLKQLRDDAYNDALRGQFGMESVEKVDKVAVGEMMLEEKRQASLNKMLNGEGSVKRSG